MHEPPEIFRVNTHRVVCDGSGDVPAALGHPRVWLEIDERGYAECGYCDRCFVLIGGPADLTNAPTVDAEPTVRAVPDRAETMVGHAADEGPPA